MNVANSEESVKTNAPKTITDLRLRFLANGYRPVPAKDKAVYLDGWSDCYPTETMVRSWREPDSKFAKHNNTGLVCGEIVGLDIDCRDLLLSKRLIKIAFGDLPNTDLRRVGMHPKVMLVYRAAKPFPGFKSKEYRLADGTKCQIEVLAKGQQFIADGVHPDTGKRYAWVGKCNPLDTSVNDIPVASLEDFEALVPKLAQAIMDAGGTEVEKGSAKKPAKKKKAEDGKPRVETFFTRVNSAALGNIGAWIQILFPSAEHQRGTDAWRVKSADLGRPYEEDISIHPDGAHDFGEENPVTPIDLVMEYHDEIEDVISAANWLCEHLDIDPETLRKASFDDLMKKVQELGASDDTEPVLREIASSDLSKSKTDRLLQALKAVTGDGMVALRQDLARILNEEKNAAYGGPRDIADLVAEVMLDGQKEDGHPIEQTPDGSLWRFSGTHWEPLGDPVAKYYLLEKVKEHVPPGGEKSYASVLRDSLTILKAVTATSKDPFHPMLGHKPIINCQNGELHLQPDGGVMLKPHDPDTRLRYCLDVRYDPSARAPLFEKTLKEIFANAEDPDDMARHFMELFGYVIQPERDIACWWLLQGEGSNGKSKLADTLFKLIPNSAIAAMPIAALDPEHNKHASAGMVGKLVLVDDDVDVNTVLPDGQLKLYSEKKTVLPPIGWTPGSG